MSSRIKEMRSLGEADVERLQEFVDAVLQTALAHLEQLREQASESAVELADAAVTRMIWDIEASFSAPLERVRAQRDTKQDFAGQPMDGRRTR